MCLETGSTTWKFTYDADGSPLSVYCNDYTYFYVKNLQGDVLGLVNYVGTPVVSYTYDAWGNILSVSGSKASTIGTWNPLRYRGYVYDNETGLYYLQSRYYNPEWGRFINADIFVATGQSFSGNNMFAYCGNNPVARKDEGGEFWHIVIGAAVGAVLNGALTVAENYFDGDPNTDWNDGLGLSMLTGAITGAFSVTAYGPVVQMAVNAVATAVEDFSDVVQDLENGADVVSTVGGYVLSIGISAVTSYSAGIGSKAATNLGKQTLKRSISAFKHGGLAVGFAEVGKAAKWYYKSAKKMIINHTKSQIIDFLNSTADDAIRGYII